jgi:uncharacterized membrane protein YbhN (UPF0104 family)
MLVRTHFIRIFIALAFFAFALRILVHEISSIKYDEFIEALRHTASWQLAGCCVATAISFASLAAYDVYTTRIVSKEKVSWRKAAFTGAAANAVSNTLGFHAFTGGALRYRIYSKEGLSAGNIARIVALSGLGIALGFASISTLALLFSSEDLGKVVGVALCLSLMGFLFWLAKGSRQLNIWKWSIPLPSSRNAAQLMLIGLIEMLAAIVGLYILLPSGIPFSFSHFIILYMSGIGLGIISSAPGGIGIFEATILTAFPSQAKAGLLSALMFYRLIYNILPFCIAISTLTIFEVRQRENQLERG